MTTPDSFLDGNGVNKGAAWSSIIQHSPLGFQPPTQANGNITIRITSLWDLDFSSSNNENRFGPVPPSTSNASTQDDQQDALFGLLVPAPSPVITFEAARRNFGVTAENTPPELADFVTLVDPDGLLPLTLDPTKDARSALWALSGSVYGTVVLLVFQLPDTSRRNIQTFISNTYGLAIELISGLPRLSLRMHTTYTPNAATLASLESSSVYQMVVDVQINGFELSLIFTPGSSDMRLSNPPGALPQQASVFDRLNTAFLGNNTSTGLSRGDLPDSSQGQSPFNNLLSSIDFWYLSLGKSTEISQVADANGGFGSVPGPLYWQINLIAEWQASIGAVVALQYDSRSSSFSGRLLFNTDALPPFARRQYDYDRYLDIALVTSKALPAPYDLWTLFNHSAKAPPQIPHLVVEGGLVFTKIPEDGGFTLAFSTTAVADVLIPTPSKRADAAPEGFQWDMVSANVLIQHSTTESLEIHIFSQIALNPEHGSSLKPATLFVDAKYATYGSWLLRGQVSDLSFPLLYSYLHPSVRDSSLDILGSLALKNLDAVYTYNQAGDASSFLITASLILGDLELDLIYQYASTLLLPTDKPAAQIVKDELGATSEQPIITPEQGKEQWLFAAALGAKSPGSDLRTVVKSLAPRAADVLPDFVGGIPVNDVAGGSVVKLILRGSTDPNNIPYTAVSVAISIGEFNITFVSLSKTGDPHKPKTILRLTLDQIPMAKDVPLIKDLPQPFDKILYLWLDDETGLGLSIPELYVINEELAYLSIPKIDTKETSKDPSLPVIRPGHHFMIVDKGKVILDHCFSDEDAQSSPQGTTNPNPDPGAPVVEDSGPTKGSIDKQLPLLSITAMSLLFKHGVLGVEIDATVALGPISFSLIQFDLGIELSSVKLNNLEGVTPEADLHGLAVSLEAPPVSLAGVFIHDSDPGLESYRGGISLGFEVWKFLAVGEYAIVNNGAFKSVFVYAKLNGPLISLAFATVSGARVGLGYNSAVRSPSINELPSFPFLTDSVDSDNGDDPLAIITAMTDPSATGSAWVSPKEQSYWVVAVGAPKDPPVPWRVLTQDRGLPLLLSGFYQLQQYLCYRYKRTASQSQFLPTELRKFLATWILMLHCFMWRSACWLNSTL